MRLIIIIVIMIIIAITIIVIANVYNIMKYSAIKIVLLPMYVP